VGRSLTALIKIGGQWTVENWTNQPVRYFCRERSAERIEELVLIYSNGAFSTTRPAAGETDNAIRPVTTAVGGGLPSALQTSQMPCHQFQGRATGSATFTGGGDNFTVTNAYSATFRGRPALESVMVNGRQATGLPGVVFETTSGILRSSLTGTVASCRTAPFNITAAPYNLPDALQRPSFQLLVNYLPGTPAFLGYAGSGARTYFGLEPSVCTTGRFVDTPAPPAYDFNANWNAVPVEEAVFKFDFASRLLKQSSVAGPTAFTGSFPSPVITYSSWCFVATREGETPPPGACP
jgi:hypothetical protein